MVCGPENVGSFREGSSARFRYMDSPAGRKLVAVKRLTCLPPTCGGWADGWTGMHDSGAMPPGTRPLLMYGSAATREQAGG